MLEIYGARSRGRGGCGGWRCGRNAAAMVLGRVCSRFYSGGVAFFRLWLLMLFLLEEVLETIFTAGLLPFALPELKFPPPVLRPLPPPPP